MQEKDLIKKQRNYLSIFIFIVATSLLLRLGLALVNRQANDNHLQVVQVIMETHRLPVMFKCQECFHPKLFYVIVAALLEIFNIHNLTAQIIFVQLLNFLAGAIILAVIALFIREYPSKNRTLKLMVFALFALNPKIIAINAQASNDTFAILFSTLSLFFTYRFFKNPVPKYLGLLILFILLAVLTKVTSLVAIAAIFLGFLLNLWVDERKFHRKLAEISILLISIFVLTTLNPLSQFITNTKIFGSPIVNSSKRLPLPSIFEQTTHYKDYYYSFRPGIISIQDGFFTFKLTDLLKYPLTTNEKYSYPPHRTSFWTMLYADSYSLHFQNWPPSWQTQNDESFTVNRGIFILAILPTLFLIAGFLVELFTFLKAFFKRDRLKIHAMNNALFLLTFVGYIAFLMLACLLYRDFSFIKLAYILPGLLAFTWLFLSGAEWVVARARRGIWMVNGLIILLLGFSVWDVLLMICQLYAINIHIYGL